MNGLVSTHCVVARVFLVSSVLISLLSFTGNHFLGELVQWHPLKGPSLRAYY